MDIEATAAQDVNGEKPFSKEVERKIAPTRTKHRWIVLQYLLVACVAMGLNLYRLGEPSIWFDEVLSFERARQPLPVLLKIISTTQPNMALYYIVLHFWLHLTQSLGFLPTEIILRFPSTIFAVLGSLALFALGRRFLGTLGALTTTGLYLVNYLQLTYAQETRSYSMELLLLSISWYTLLVALTTEKRQRYWWICYVLTSVLAVYTHIFSLLVFLAHITTYFCLFILPNTWRIQVRQRLLPFSTSVIATGLLLLPILIVSRQGAKTGWLPSPLPDDVLHLFYIFCTSDLIYFPLAMLCITLGLAVICLNYLPRSRNFLAHKFALFKNAEYTSHLLSYVPIAITFICWCFVPLIASYILSQGSIHLFSARYLVVIVPPFLLLIYLGVAILPRPRLRAALAALLLLAACLTTPVYYRSAQVEDWKVTTQWLQQHYQADDGMVCFNNIQGCQVSIEYYLRAYPTGAQFPADAPGAFPWVDYDLTNVPGNSLQALDTNALSKYAEAHGRVFFIVARLQNDQDVAKTQTTTQWLDSTYKRVDQIQTRTVTIYLYQTQ